MQEIKLESLYKKYKSFMNDRNGIILIWVKLIPCRHTFTMSLVSDLLNHLPHYTHYF